MSANSLNLTINVAVISPCLGLRLTDITGLYDAGSNPFGYGAPDGVAVNDVTEVTITLTYNSLSATTLVYVFTIDEGEITAATLSCGGVTPVSIIAYLTDTSWPFSTDHPFDLTEYYGVTLPTFADDVFKTEYTISGELDSEPFELSTVNYLPVGCTSRCCINQKWVDVELNCSCNDKSSTNIMYMEGLYNKFIYSTDAGSLANALVALRELQRLCGSDCGCGC